MRTACLLATLACACAPTVAPVDVDAPLDADEDGTPAAPDSGSAAAEPTDTASSDSDADDVEELGDAIFETLTLDFSQDRGFYEAAFELSITASEAEARIRWTLDGSDPRTSERAQEGLGTVTLAIDPASRDGRDPAPGVVVRAFAELDGFTDSRVDAHTYLFVGQAAALSPHDTAPGPGWPAPYETDDNFSPIHAMDYGLDPRVTEDAVYAPLLEDALKAIPSISIGIETAHLFDDSTGIYIHPMEHGDAWERPASVELIDPLNAHEVQAGMGLRIRGGWSRHHNNPKHAFRLFFRSEYGDPKLDFPLFEDEGTDRFDKVDLRTAQNYSWSFKTTAGAENTFLRDVFSRDLQLSLGRPATRSRFYHLYINGVYWGLYQTQERAEARFAESYFGGDVDDYDVVKVNGDDPRGRVIEATDGDLALWEEVWERCEAGFASDADYHALLGLEPEGLARDDDLRVLVDVDNLIDYMLVIFYTGNFDAPTGSFTSNQGANNFFAIIDRTDPEQGFRFFAHDSEHSLLPDAWGPGQGLAEDRVNLGTRTDSYRMNVSRFEDFHPQWVHHRLMDNARYRARFAARARALLAEDGPMGDAAVRALLEARKAQIELAIIAESARWGDAKNFEVDGRSWRTRDLDWAPAVDRLMSAWVPHRRAVVIGQLEAAGLW